MKRAIARYLKTRKGASYDGVPQVLIEAIADDVLSYLSQRVSGEVTIELLDDAESCESCEMWFDSDRIVTARTENDDTLSFCKDCFEVAKDEGGIAGSFGPALDPKPTTEKPE